MHGKAPGVMMHYHSSAAWAWAVYHQENPGMIMYTDLWTAVMGANSLSTHEGCRLGNGFGLEVVWSGADGIQKLSTSYTLRIPYAPLTDRPNWKSPLKQLLTEVWPCNIPCNSEAIQVIVWSACYRTHKDSHELGGKDGFIHKMSLRNNSGVGGLVNVNFFNLPNRRSVGNDSTNVR
jgi:hypothetical protein